MSYRHTAKRRDANEPTIVLALRAVGATVQQLDGKGVPDLLVGYRGKTHLLEVKNPENTKGALVGQKRTKGRAVRTAEQVEWFAAWKGSPVIEVVNADEALVAIGALRPKVKYGIITTDGNKARASRVDFRELVAQHVDALMEDGCKRHGQNYPCRICAREVVDGLSKGGVKL